MTTAPNVVAIDDPAEVAYWRRRRVVRRRQFWTIVVAAVLATGYVGWKIGRHLIASAWLEANHFKVVWEADKDTWKRGGVTTVKYVDPRSFFQDAGRHSNLRLLTWLHRIEGLDLSQLTGLRDAHLVILDDLTGLRSLNLDWNSRLPWMWQKQESPGLTDATLARIGRLSRLRTLSVGGQVITDAGLKHLAILDQLQSLDLVGTEITDAGLEHLKTLRSLKSVDLTRTNVTAQGVSNFEAAMPGVKVVADPPMPPSPAAPRPQANR
jgi:hypothetical protein